MNKALRLGLLALMALLLPCAVPAEETAPPAATTKISFLGHAAFEITTPKGHVLFIDPWLSNPQNPAAKDGKDPLSGIQKADYILLTHGHFDHVGESVALAKKTGAKLIASFELGQQMVRYMGFPEAQAGMDTLTNPGGRLDLLDGEVTVHVTPAVHASGLEVEKDGKKEIVYGGAPLGFVIEIAGGPTIYHTGDTAYFSDMKVLGERFDLDLALINIGGHFGMSPRMAEQAAKDVHAKLTVPMHFRTFPVLTQNATPFQLAIEKAGLKFRELQPGESLEFSGKTLKP